MMGGLCPMVLAHKAQESSGSVLCYRQVQEEVKNKENQKHHMREV